MLGTRLARAVVVEWVVVEGVRIRAWTRRVELDCRAIGDRSWMM